MFAPRRPCFVRIFFAPPHQESPFWPDDAQPDADEIDDDSPLELDDEHWDALQPDDDYEPHPEPGDFWPDQDAA
jgi:hypothetical protein